MAGAISSTGKTNYTTPEYLLKPVRIFFERLRAQGHYAFHVDGPPIDIDPCSNCESTVRAAVNIQLEPVAERSPSEATIQGNGLTYEMPENANQYINPPFGRGILAWFLKAYRDYKEKNVATILCVPDTPDTKAWMKNVLPMAEGRCQIGHRPKFGGMSTGIPKTCAFLYFGPPQFYQDFLTVFQHMGRVECPRLVYADQVDITVWKPTKKNPSPDFLDQLKPPSMVLME